MFDPKMLDEVAQKLSSVLPGSLQSVQQDIEQNFKTVLQNAFAKMELVTREEFDVQTSVLSRTRSKVDALEKQLSELEVNIEALIKEKQQ
ncbi:MAG: accessory factor UbiK family protein [Gammaproteobacteria bacterium]|nr:accessory factor UbiK family protein [Gammaproteobacteria bacterium]